MTYTRLSQNHWFVSMVGHYFVTISALLGVYDRMNYPATSGKGCPYVHHGGYSYA